MRRFWDGTKWLTEEEYHEVMHQELILKGFMWREGFPGETFQSRKVIRFYWRDKDGSNR